MPQSLVVSRLRGPVMRKAFLFYIAIFIRKVSVVTGRSDKSHIMLSMFFYDWFIWKIRDTPLCVKVLWQMPSVGCHGNLKSGWSKMYNRNVFWFRFAMKKLNLFLSTISNLLYELDNYHEKKTSSSRVSSAVQHADPPLRDLNENYHSQL